MLIYSIYHWNRIDGNLWYFQNITFALLSAYYIIFSMTLSALALMCTFFILRVHSHPADDPVPLWIKCLCLCRCTQPRQAVQPLEPNDDLKNPKLAFSDTKAAQKTQWQKLARRLDKIAFALFLSIYVAASVILCCYIVSCANGSYACQNLLPLWTMAI